MAEHLLLAHHPATSRVGTLRVEEGQLVDHLEGVHAPCWRVAHQLHTAEAAGTEWPDEAELVEHRRSRLDRGAGGGAGGGEDVSVEARADAVLPGPPRRPRVPLHTASVLAVARFATRERVAWLALGKGVLSARVATARTRGAARAILTLVPGREGSLALHAC